MTELIDRKGEIFGKLTVLETVRKSWYKDRYRTTYRCQCSCGRIKDIIESNIHKTKSCGKAGCKLSPGRPSKKIGIRKGRLVVLSAFSKQSSSGRKITYYKCQCDCGKIIETQFSRTGNSCGCLQKENLIERSRKELGWASITAIWSYYKRNAKTRNLEWNLSRDQFTNLIQQKCFYCQIDASDLWETPSGDNLVRSGIDRVNNTLGYILENCVSCCKICNRAKGSLDITTFNGWIERLKNK